MTTKKYEGSFQERGRQAVAAYKERHYTRVRESARWQKLKASFGLSKEEYISLLEKQSNVCAICSQPETSIDGKNKKTRYLAVDHCHTTGKVRGLLCTRCNNALGGFMDNIGLLNNAISYLSESVS